MSELIPIVTTDEGVQAVMGRRLHAFLEVATPYDKWFPRMVDYGFSAGQDFSTEMSESTGGRPRTDHIVTLDMAKEISMIQRSEKGKQARQYFLECERRAKEAAPRELTGRELMARALMEADSTIKELEATSARQAAELEAAAPKITYHDEFVAQYDLIQFRTLANQLNLNEGRLRAMLAAHRWIYDDPVSRWSNSKGKKVTVHRWRAYADKKPYFHLVPQHEAPRLNGEVQQTLKITPAGAAAIVRAVQRWGGQTELEVA
ncbi:phage antirepressor Ant [Corynebacterium mastitidis]|uniref:phage antirepressor Ant n=1 Tax=Corynebacterium mastitidis TaxID=161890 RepID=UPI000381FDAF|nr:phage antirepressor Ant [Corynebacterium mastitidis]